MNENDFVVDEFTGSSDDVSSESSASAFALTNDAVGGTISSTYLDYVAGIVYDLPYSENYVFYKSSDYEYILAHGVNLFNTSSGFQGQDCNIVRLYRENNNYNSLWYIERYVDDVDIDTLNTFTYSNLGEYASLKRGFSHVEIYTLLFSICVMFLYFVLRDIFKCIRR